MPKVKKNTEATVATATEAPAKKTRKPKGESFTRVSLKELNDLFQNQEVVVPVRRLWLAEFQNAAKVLAQLNPGVMDSLTGMDLEAKAIEPMSKAKKEAIEAVQVEKV